MKQVPFDQEAAQFIVWCMSERGMTLKAALDMMAPAWPNGKKYARLVVYGWMESNPAFALSISRARATLAEKYFDHIAQTVDTMDSDSVTVDREKIRAWQWMAKVTNPHVYGEKREVISDVTVTQEQRHVIDVSELDSAARDQLRSALLSAERLAKAATTE